MNTFNMRTHLIPNIILYFFLNHSTVYSQGFRGFKWGATQTQVIKKEGKPTEQSDDERGHYLFYSKSVSGIKNVTASFTFTNNKLHTGFYLFDNITKIQKRDISSALIEKYGQPKRLVATDGSKSIQYQWIKGDTRVTLNKGVITDFVITYYHNFHYIEIEKTYRKNKREGL